MPMGVIWQPLDLPQNFAPIHRGRPSTAGLVTAVCPRRATIQKIHLQLPLTPNRPSALPKTRGSALRVPYHHQWFGVGELSQCVTCYTELGLPVRCLNRWVETYRRKCGLWRTELRLTRMQSGGCHARMRGTCGFGMPIMGVGGVGISSDTTAGTAPRQCAPLAFRLKAIRFCTQRGASGVRIP